jgi:hypothetical protein
MIPSKVELKNLNGKFQLYKNGKHYIIKGAGCEFGNIALLAKNGGNTFRTWRVDNGKETGEQVLKNANNLGLMVVMGIDVARQRHGFDYNDSIAVAKQKEEIRKQVLRLKDYPSLLVWGIGNELNLRATNPKVWNAVNEIAIMIHKIDPNHPVTTMLAGIDKNLVNDIKVRCPDLDFISIQMYGDLINLQQRITESGYNGPYMVTEWGATGHWEVKQTSWNAPIEQTSSEKAASIQERYEKAIATDTNKCIGNFVFVWEQKQERTPTWYGLFSENGEQTEAIDVMYKIWNNKWPENRCPSIKNPLINGMSAYDNITLQPTEKITAIIEAIDLDNDTLSYVWEIMPESTDLKDGGDKESRPKTMGELITKTNKIELTVPEQEGAYRLFIYVLDGKNHAGTANIPFLIKKNG